MHVFKTANINIISPECQLNQELCWDICHNDESFFYVYEAWVVSSETIFVSDSPRNCFAAPSAILFLNFVFLKYIISSETKLVESKQIIVYELQKLAGVHQFYTQTIS